MGKIPAIERPAVYRLLIYSFIVAASYTLVRTAGDSLFLAHVGSEHLAVIFLLSGMCTAGVAGAWYFLTQRLPLGRSIQLSGFTLGTLTLLAWWLLPKHVDNFWLLGGIYLLTEVKGAVNAINIISAMNSTLGRHSSKLSWARVGLGLPLAGLCIGSLLGIEAAVFSLRTWLLLAAVLDFGSVVAAAGLGRFKVPNGLHAIPVRQRVPALTGDATARLKSYVNSARFGWWIGVLIAAKVVVLTIVTFEWKVAVNDFFGGDEASLAQFFGAFYGAVGLATLLVQAIATTYFLSRQRLHIPILLMPLGLLMVSVTIIVGSGVMMLLVLTTAGKSLEVWRRSVHDTTLNMLYTKIKRKKRRKIIAINTALVKPLAEVAAAGVLLLGSTLVHQSAMVALAIVWLYAAIALIRLIRSPIAGKPTAVHQGKNPDDQSEPKRRDAGRLSSFKG